MKNIQNVLMIVLLAINVVVGAVVAAPSDDLSRTLNAMRSMKANFVQTTYDNQGRAAQVSKGTLSWIRPGKFRWEAKQPIPQTIIANGKRVWIVDPDLMQVTIRKVNKEFGETPTMLLSDNVVQLENRFVVTVKNRGKIVSYILKPKKSDSTFNTIELIFQNNQILSMHLEDQLGHMTKIDFSNVIANPTLSANLFQYKPAAGMDVIEDH